MIGVKPLQYTVSTFIYVRGFPIFNNDPVKHTKKSYLKALNIGTFKFWHTRVLFLKTFKQMDINRKFEHVPK